VTAPGLFVAGTDTGVGKTVVTAGLTARLRAAGLATRAVKPAQTGAPDDDDAAEVARICGDSDAATCLRRLGPALAPRVAAAETDTPLSYEAILDDCRDAAAASEFAVVEGIGGLRVPLAGDREVLDLAAALGFPTVVVARSGLGTLNHTALSVTALENCGLTVTGIVLNEYEGGTLAARTNPAELERMTGRPVATLPPLDVDDPAAVVRAVTDEIPSSFVPVDRDI